MRKISPTQAARAREANLQVIDTMIFRATFSPRVRSFWPIFHIGMVPRLITRDFKQTFPAHYTTIYVSVVYWWRRRALKYSQLKSPKLRYTIMYQMFLEFPILTISSSKRPFSSARNAVFTSPKLCFHRLKT